MGPRATVFRVVAALADMRDEQKVIAQYRVDGPASVLPPGYWMVFAQVVASRELGRKVGEVVWNKCRSLMQEL